MLKTGIHILNEADDREQVTVRLYGPIGEDGGITADNFTQTHTFLEQEFKQINYRVHSAGGHVTDGNVIFNCIRNSKVPVHMYVDGMAASIASIIALAGEKTFMARNSLLMIHKPKGKATGDSDSLRETAELMDKMEDQLVAIYAEKCGGNAEELKALYMVRGKNTWIDARNALESKLIDGITDDETVKRKAPANILNDASEVYAFYNSAIEDTQITNSDMELKKKLVKELNLEIANEAEDTAIVEAVNTLITAKDEEITTLKAELETVKNSAAEAEKAAKKQAAEALVDEAINAGKLAKEDREEMVADAIENHAVVKKMLDKMQVKVNITDMLNKDRQSKEKEGDDKTEVSGTASARLREIQAKTGFR